MLQCCIRFLLMYKEKHWHHTMLILVNNAFMLCKEQLTTVFIIYGKGHNIDYYIHTFYYHVILFECKRQIHICSLILKYSTLYCAFKEEMGLSTKFKSHFLLYLNHNIEVTALETLSLLSLLDANILSPLSPLIVLTIWK